MRRCFLVLMLSLIVGSSAVPVSAKTFYPMIARTSPAAVQAGASMDCEVVAEHGWYGPTKVLITGSGVTGEVLPPKTKADESATKSRGETITIRFTAVSDALPGLRDFRVMTARGPSTLGQIVVVRSPILREEGVNNSIDKAQAVSAPVTICGAIESNEDVDVFKFQIAEPKSLVFHLHGQRLLQKLGPVAYHSDPMLMLRNSAGTVLASNDNFFGSDPLLSYRFEKPGDYFLEVRDVRYAGYRDWTYSLEIHDRPLVLQALPAVVAPGSSVTAKLAGFNLPTDASFNLQFPNDTPTGIHWVDVGRINGQPSEPLVPVLVTKMPLVAELPANNDAPEKAQAISLPAGITGVLESPDDVDGFAFEAKKGDRLTFKILAQVLGSPVDANLRILNDKGDVLIENDDASDKTGNADCRNEVLFPDSRIADWTVPQDGRFVVEVRDTHLRGGERFTYFLEARPRSPGLHLEIDTDKTILAPGTSSPAFVRVFREEGLTGQVRLSVDGLPPGVTAVCGEVPADGQDACIFLTAAENAPPGICANLRVIAEAIDAENNGNKITAVAVPYQELRRDGGARYMTPVEMHTVGVADVLDLKRVRANETKLALKPGEKRTVQVTLERSAGFTEPVTLTAIHSQHVWVFGRCLPAGVTVEENESKLRLTGNDVQGTIVLNVAKDAKPSPPRLTPLMANVAINFSLKMIYTGDPVEVSIVAP